MKALIAGIATILIVMIVFGQVQIAGCNPSESTYTITGTAKVVAQYTTFPVSYQLGSKTSGTEYWSSKSGVVDCIINPMPLVFDILNVRGYASLDNGPEQTIFNEASVGILIPYEKQTQQFKFVGVVPGVHILKIRTTWDANQHERIDTYEVQTFDTAVMQTAVFKDSIVTR